MKNSIKLLSLLLLFAFSQQVVGQSSVRESTKYAEKLLSKVKKRRYKKFNENYEQALKSMAKIESNATTNEYGYDKFADNVDS